MAFRSADQAGRKNAVSQELHLEARDLNAEFADYTANVEPATPIQRAWSTSFSFIAHDGGMSELSTSTRELLDLMEKGATKTMLAQGVDGLRTLLNVNQQTKNHDAMLDVSALSILDDLSWGAGYYLSIDSPRPGGRHPHGWSIHIGRWEPDHPDDENNGDSTGTAVVICDLPTAPAVADLVDLLNLSAEGASRHETWAASPVGESLTGTKFTVTSRHDTRE